MPRSILVRGSSRPRTIFGKGILCRDKLQGEKRTDSGGGVHRARKTVLEEVMDDQWFPLPLPPPMAASRTPSSQEMSLPQKYTDKEIHFGLEHPIHPALPHNCPHNTSCPHVSLSRGPAVFSSLPALLRFQVQHFTLQLTDSTPFPSVLFCSHLETPLLSAQRPHPGCWMLLGNRTALGRAAAPHLASPFSSVPHSPVSLLRTSCTDKRHGDVKVYLTVHKAETVHGDPSAGQLSTLRKDLLGKAFEWQAVCTTKKGCGLYLSIFKNKLFV